MAMYICTMYVKFLGPALTSVHVEPEKSSTSALNLLGFSGAAYYGF